MRQKRDFFGVVAIKARGSYVAGAEGIAEQGLRESPVPFFWREFLAIETVIHRFLCTSKEEVQARTEWKNLTTCFEDGREAIDNGRGVKKESLALEEEDAVKYRYLGLMLNGTGAFVLTLGEQRCFRDR